MMCGAVKGATKSPTESTFYKLRLDTHLAGVNKGNTVH